MRFAPLLLTTALLVAPTVLALDPAITTQTLFIRIWGTTGMASDVNVETPAASQATCSRTTSQSLDFYTALTVTVSCTLRTRDCTPVQVTARHPVDEFPGHATSTRVVGECGGGVECTAEEGVPCARAGLFVATLTRTYRCVAEPFWVAQTDVFAEWGATCSLRVA